MPIRRPKTPADVVLMISYFAELNKPLIAPEAAPPPSFSSVCGAFAGRPRELCSRVKAYGLDPARLSPRGAGSPWIPVFFKGVEGVGVKEPVFTAENGVWTELFQSDPRQKCSESTKDSSAFFLDGLENPSPIPHFQL